MRKMFLLAGVLAITMLGVSCSKDNDKKEEVPSYQFKSTQQIEVNNIMAAKEIVPNPIPGRRPDFKGYQKYSFAKKSVVDTDDWDIAFKGSNIIVNGGTSPNEDEIKVTGKGALYLTEGLLDGITSVEFGKLKEYKLEGKDWRNYDTKTHIVTPIAGKIIIVKTHDEQYVKLRIDSYYKDKKDQQPNPDYRNIEGGYYNFTFIKG